ncbi:rhodanese-like domain-containing protein [bacterium]|jgi:rhodanese-related sulfurtransferase|nr:rhodanese-like domain-containing protein [bacterium]
MSMDELSPEIEVESVAKLLAEKADFLLLDVREEFEFATAAINGSQLLPMSELQDRVTELDPHRERHVVVHCHHGVRSMQVAQALKQYGFSKVQSMAGGIEQWSLLVDSSVPRY